MTTDPLGIRTVRPPCSRLTSPSIKWQISKRSAMDREGDVVLPAPILMRKPNPWYRLRQKCHGVHFHPSPGRIFTVYSSRSDPARKSLFCATHALVYAYLFQQTPL